MALVLSRRSGEEIILTLEPDYTQAELEEILREGISITIKNIDGGCARIGIQAPDVIRIMRGELP